MSVSYSRGLAVTIDFRGQTITTYDEVDLLRITLDNRLTFGAHISKVCCKAAGLLNVPKRLGVCLPVTTRKMLAEALIFSTFNYCQLVWTIFQLLSKMKKELKKGFYNL